MTNAPEKTTKSAKRKAPLLIPAVAAVLGAAGAIYTLQNTTADSFADIDHLPGGAVVETFLQTKAATSSLPARGGVIDLPESLRPSPEMPYRISSSIRMPDDSYRDFTLTVSAETIDVVTDGFRSGDGVTLTLNGVDAFWNIPADWSGKLELSAALPDDNIVRACIDVESGADTLSLCHTIKEGQTS